jgi:hypothetical protein
MLVEERKSLGKLIVATHLDQTTALGEPFANRRTFSRGGPTRAGRSEVPSKLASYGPLRRKSWPKPILSIRVGTRMRQRRTLLGMSQSKVGEAFGLTFQQIQKYERGANRIGSSRLYEFAKVLDVPVSYFFDEMPSNALSGRPMSCRGTKDFGGRCAV